MVGLALFGLGHFGRGLVFLLLAALIGLIPGMRQAPQTSLPPPA